MTYDLISNAKYNMSEGFHVVFKYANDITGGVFINAFLLAVWLIFAIGSYSIQKRNVGTGDFPMSLAVAGWVVTITAFLLRLKPLELTDTTSVAVCIVVGALSTLWFLFSRDN